MWPWHSSISALEQLTDPNTSTAKPQFEHWAVCRRLRRACPRPRCSGSLFKKLSPPSTLLLPFPLICPSCPQSLSTMLFPCLSRSGLLPSLRPSLRLGRQKERVTRNSVTGLPYSQALGFPLPYSTRCTRARARSLSSFNSWLSSLQES